MSATTASVTSSQQRLPTTNRIMMETMTTPQQQQPPGNNIMAAQTTCNNCYTRLFELKRQAMKCMMNEYQKMNMGTTTPMFDSLPHIVYQNLQLSDLHLAGTVNGICTYCGMHIEFIKKHALIQTTNFAPFLSRNMLSQPQTDLQQYNEIQLMGRPVVSYGESTDTCNGRRVQGLNNTENSGSDTRKQPPARSPASPASQFFTEAARKYNIASKKRSSKKEKVRKDESDIFPTNFSRLLRKDPPANPPGLFKYMGRRVDGKVSVMLRISPNTDEDQTDSFISVDHRRKHISVLQPKNLENIPTKLQTNNGTNAAPKLYGFDATFERDMPQTRISSTSVLDVLHAVINGGEGCLLSYGASNTGKTSTMVGSDSSNKELGVLPSAISWLYSLLEDCKQRTGARISVRVSAVEVVGCHENLRDLLSEQTSAGDSADSGASPGIYLREDPIGGTVQLGNVSEPQAVSAEKAAFYLDAALAARTIERDSTSERQGSHMIFTIHVYQYRVEKNHRKGAGSALPYSGGRSRLHLIDLSCVNTNFDKIQQQQQNSSAPSHAGLGQIIVAMLNGFKQLPYRDSKITRLLKDSIGNLTCRSTLIVHVSDDEKNYSKTCQTLQMASKINRSRRRRNKTCSSSSDNSCDESGRRRRPHPAMVKTHGIEDCVSSDYNTSSAGEDSCDTVIYMGSNGHVSDRDLTDNERPPSPNTFKAMKMKLPSSSEDEKTERIPIKPQVKKEVSLEPCQIVKMESEPKKFTPSVDIAKDIIKPCSPCEDEEKITTATIPPPITTTVNEVSEQVTTKEPPSPAPFKMIPTSEKAINVVAPLIIKKDEETNRTTSPSTDKTTNRTASPTNEAFVPSNDSSNDETKNSLVNQLIENRNVDDVILVPTTDEVDNNIEKVPTEKELRKREKRIAKLLKESLSSDDLTVEEVNNKINTQKNDGYTSDNSYRKKSESLRDGYISAPENNFRKKPIQIVRGTVRQQQSLDETLTEECKDDIISKLLNSLQQCDENLQKQVDSPSQQQKDESSDSVFLEKSSTDLRNLKQELKNREADLHTRISNWKKDIPESCLDEEISETSNETCKQKLPETCLDDPKLNTEENDTKITDLSHVITVSSVPNFTVTKKEGLKDIISNSNIKTNVSNLRNQREESEENLKTRYNEFSNSPLLERSYSREDTCSLVSAAESDAYDSDTYSSCTASPAVSRRQGRTPRLRYRWSTVYEEDEQKKEIKTDKNTTTPKNKKKDLVVIDNEPKPARVIGSPKKSHNKSQSKADKKILSPKSEKKRFNFDQPLSPKSGKKSSKQTNPLSPKAQKKSTTPLSPKEHKKFSLLSPKSERKSKQATESNADKRMSGCSDASSGLGSNSSQTNSLHSSEGVRIEEFKMTRENSLSKIWPFGRNKSRKSRSSSSGYVSDGHLTDTSSVRSSRKYRFFSKSKSSMYSDGGHSSGYDTSITEGGMTSCAEDLTDNESGGQKKRKRFLGGFRRRSTNDLNSSRGRVKKPLWLDSRRCQSDDEGVQIKVYEIDGPTQMNRRQCRSEELRRSRIQPRRLDDLRKTQEHLKKSPVGAAKYTHINDHQSYPVNGDNKTAEDLHRENGAIGKKLKVLKNHIQVVTCFDANTSTTQRRKVTQI